MNYEVEHTVFPIIHRFDSWMNSRSAGAVLLYLAQAPENGKRKGTTETLSRYSKAYQDSAPLVPQDLLCPQKYENRMAQVLLPPIDWWRVATPHQSIKSRKKFLVHK